MVRGIKISVLPGGKLKVAASPWIPKFVVTEFVKKHQDWIDKQVAKMKQVPERDSQQSRGEFLRLKPKARELVVERLNHFNQFYGHVWTSISIRDQVTRWGSCSRSGGLSFNYRLAKLPLELADYVVVHELCHLRQMNHSEKFWDLVGKTLPNYRILRQRLRNFNAYKID